MAENEFGAL